MAIVSARSGRLSARSLSFAISGRATLRGTRPEAREGARGRAPIRLLLATAVLAGLTACSAWGLWTVRGIAATLPAAPDIYVAARTPQTTILSSDGTELARFAARNQSWKPFSSISPYLVKATLAVEDARFYHHGAVDPTGVLRAIWANIRSGNATDEGGSTITQQLARNLYLSGAKTLRRKVAEVILAGRIEQRYSKRQILEAYLNQVYYGHGAYGAEAAAQTYFGIPAARLDLGQAALLAGLPQRPSELDPVENPAGAIARQKQVLQRMVGTRAITEADSARAEAEALHILQASNQGAHWKAPYFVAHVLSWLRARYGPGFLYSGAKVVTTLDWPAQQAAERALRRGLRHSAANTGALVAIEPRTGWVRALVGGPSYHKSQFDAATMGVRQPGSAFKPFVYAAAFDTDVCTLITTVDDHKLVLGQPPNQYAVQDFGHRYMGAVSVLTALEDSLNSVAVQVAQQTGIGNVVGCARHLGISTPMDENLPLALGDSGVRPLDLCTAYSAFATGGVRYEPECVLSVTAADGTPLFLDDPAARWNGPTLSKETVDQINVALRDVVLHGTGAAAAWIPDAHGKTGTTNASRDAWFAGYTGALAAVVWMAHETQSMGQRAPTYQPMPGSTGGGLCAPVWARFMWSALHREKEIAVRQGGALPTVPQPAEQLLLSQLSSERQQELADPTTLPTLDRSAVAVASAQAPGFEEAQDGSPPIVVTAPEGQEPRDQGSGSGDQGQGSPQP